MRGIVRLALRGLIFINDAAAPPVRFGDIVIIGAFVQLTAVKAKASNLSVVFIDAHNRIRAVGKNGHGRIRIARA